MFEPPLGGGWSCSWLHPPPINTIMSGLVEEPEDGSNEKISRRRMAKGREANSRGNDRKKSTKQGGVRAEKGKVDGRWLRKTWSDVAKGMNED